MKIRDCGASSISSPIDASKQLVVVYEHLDRILKFASMQRVVRDELQTISSLLSEIAMVLNTFDTKATKK